MHSPMYKLIKNAYINKRYTLNHIKGFTSVGTLSIDQYYDITGLVYIDTTDVQEN